MLMTVQQLCEADNVVRAFLRTTGRRRTINYHLSSYGWKHVVEEWAKIVYGHPVYIPNSLFVDIARELRIKSKRCAPDSPNWWFALVHPEWAKELI